MDANPFWPELGRQVAHRALQSGLGYAHDIVILHHHLAAVISHGEERAALAHERLGKVGHANKRPARYVQCGEKAFTRDVDNAALQSILGREGDRMHKKVELAPHLADLLENSLHLTGDANVERHHNRSFERLRERIDKFFSFFVQIGHGELGAQGTKCLGAAPGDRLIVGNADHEPFLAIEKLGFDNGQLCGIARLFEWGGFGLHIVLRNFLQFAKRLTPIFSILDMGDLAPVDAQAPFAPGRDIDCELIDANNRHKLLDRGALAGRQLTVRFPVNLAQAH